MRGGSPSPSDHRALDLAAAVIRTADREHPADAVLRLELKSQRNLPRDTGRSASRAVFAYYRWWKWLDAQAPLVRQIEAALTLSRQFARQPEQFTEPELGAKAVPEWTAEQVPLSLEILRAWQREPTVWLRARLGQGAALAAKMGDCQAAGPGPLDDALRYQGSTDLFRTEEFHAGEFELQDLHSQAVGWLCAPRPGETWWDACAGTGGKTLHLSDLMQNKGLIWASDRAGWRLQILKRRAARARVFNYRWAPWEGTQELPTKTRFDGVLVDAPCSNLGTWQRNPHARWSTTLEDVRRLAAAQQSLLAQVAPTIKPGGKLVYSVCSLARAETEEVVAAFQAAFPEFEPLPAPSPFEPELPPRPCHTFLPQERSGNGMFVALWRRADTAAQPEAPPQPGACPALTHGSG